jgi:ubiquinone/menaquinone biosynthesis C-methylase UbiE
LENSDFTARAAEAFTRQAVVFDSIYTGDSVIEYKRERVRDHILKHIPHSSKILELNSGTGEDALFFGEKGFSVHATDISPGMQKELIGKVKKRGLENRISHELRSYSDLGNLLDPGPYDLIFSNFAGLNCTSELNKVLEKFSQLLRPGGLVVLVIMPHFCLWEVLSVFKGNFKNAFRRFFRPQGTQAHIEGVYFKCWYYEPSYIIKHLEKEFILLDLEGLCTLVPPSYMAGFPKRNPKVYAQLVKWESKFKNRWPWKLIGDYYIISMKKI